MSKKQRNEVPHPWTPGPWIPKGPNLKPGATPDWYDAVITEYEPEPEQDDQICELGDWTESRTEQNANACLIAAAPDLYEALEELHSSVIYEKEHGPSKIDGPVLNACIKANKALAKAKEDNQ